MNGESAFSQSVDIAFENGLLVVVAAGNRGHAGITAPADSFNVSFFSFPEYKCVKVISVGAVDSFGYLTTFSSVGPTADFRIKPEVV